MSSVEPSKDSTSRSFTVAPNRSARIVDCHKVDISDLARKLDELTTQVDRLLERDGHASERFLGVAAAAAYAGLSPESIRRLLSTGKLTALRPVRGRIVVDRQELESLILSSTHQPRSGRGFRR